MRGQFQQELSLPRDAVDNERTIGQIQQAADLGEWVNPRDKRCRIKEKGEPFATPANLQSCCQTSVLQPFPQSLSSDEDKLGPAGRINPSQVQQGGTRGPATEKAGRQQAGSTLGSGKSAGYGKSAAGAGGKPRRGVSEDEKIAERNRKGRERSMRTRLRNAGRLKSLQENCAHLQVENGVLRQIVVNMRGESEWTVVRALLHKLETCRGKRPVAYQFASKEAEVAAYKGVGLGSVGLIEVGMQGGAGQTQPVSVTETNKVGGCAGGKEEDREDTRSTNGVSEGVGKERGLDLEGEGDLFGWLTEMPAGFRGEEARGALPQLESLAGFSLGELEGLVGSTDD